MPELPEVETSVKGIARIQSKTIKRFNINQLNLRWKIDVSALETLVGQRILNIRRRAKYIIISCGKGSMIIHLGMSGTLRLAKNTTNVFKTHDHFEIIFEKIKLIFNDPRRFGSLHFTLNPDDHFLIKHLGTEPLSNTFNNGYLFNVVKKLSSPIKSILMNQRWVVGIGNIYVNEILFASKINPRRRGKYITKKMCKEIVIHTKKILNRAIKKGGTTLKDFHNPSGDLGYFKIDLKVYNRQGEPCFVCKNKIDAFKINQRSTFVCKKCQN
tara:strand:- start:450 stop:1259 length:810 start_codon:yes stop_codon:yes gene_type:complete